MIIHITPAYGRGYKTRGAAQKDWDDNKDFLVNDIMSRHDRKSINKAQTTPRDQIVLRFWNLRKVARLENVHK